MDDLNSTLEIVRAFADTLSGASPQRPHAAAIVKRNSTAMTAGRDIRDSIINNIVEDVEECPTEAHRYACHLIKEADELTAREIIMTLLSRPRLATAGAPQK